MPQTKGNIRILPNNCLMLLPSLVNIIYMHLRVADLCTVSCIEDGRWIRGGISVLFDAFSLALIIFLCTGRRIRPTAIGLACLTWLWTSLNTVYATYFKSYFTFSALSETGTLGDLPMWQYVCDSWNWTDIIPLTATIALTAFCLKKSEDREERTIDTIFLTIPTLTLLVIFCALKLFIFNHRIVFPNRDTTRQLSLMPTEHRMVSRPTITILEVGIIRGQILPAIFWHNSNKELTDEERTGIARFISSLDNSPLNRQESESLVEKRKNVVFIILESYLASTVNKKVNGREITPFLNRLRQDKKVCFNDNMMDNTTLCSSCDGQFIYMTGLLPLHDRLTVSELNGKHIPALPKWFRQHGYTTMMTLPTEADVWQQNVACRTYGIDSLYTTDRLGKTWLSDDQMVKYAIRNEKKVKTPFFHVMVTLSTHGPFNGYSEYLDACTLMDKSLEEYFNSLKKRSLYDNTIIFLASDHGRKDDKVLNIGGNDAGRISFICVNTPQNIKYHKDTINQVDVFNSIVDILGIKSIDDTRWYGIGKSIFQPGKYRNTITSEAWVNSSYILCGDYFRHL